MLILVPTAFEARRLFDDSVQQSLTNRGAARCHVGEHEVQVAIKPFGLAAQRV